MHSQFFRTSRIRSLGIIFALLLLSGASVAQSPDTAGAMSVEETSGAVRYRSSSPWLAPSVGQVIKLPAVVSTGDDGDIKFRQHKTVISVASNTALDFFPGSEPGAPIQRVVQNQGSAFYDIESRESGKMRVETPYLVAVIKGTQFNVTTNADSSAISLFEGRLQVEAPDIGDVVDLHAGQIAKRHRDDTRITVLSMENGEPIARSDARSSSSGEDDQSGNHADNDFISETGVDGTAGAGLHVDTNGPEGGVNVGVDLPGASAVIGSEVAVGSGKIDLGVGANVALSELSIATGIETSLSAVDGSIGVGVDTGIGVGDTAVDLGLNSAIDLAAGDIDLGLDSSIDTGVVPVDVGLDTGVDLGADTIDVDLGVSVVDLDLGLGLEIDTGDLLDLGLDESIDNSETVTTPLDDVTDILPDLGGLIGL